MEKYVKLLYWAPRVLGILFLLLISSLALDVFGEGYTAHELLVALFMHLVPSFLVLVALLIGWRWERVGGWLFIGLFLFYVWMAWEHFGGILVVGGPLLLIGVLFLISKKYAQKTLP